MKPSLLPSLIALAIAGSLALPAISPADDSSKKKPAPAAEKAKPRKPDPERKHPAAARPRELQKQLDATRRELDQARDSLHEAQKELGSKAEVISSLEAKLSSVSKQLEKAQADLKKSGTAAADLEKAQRALDAERKKVAELRDELKAVQQKAATAKPAATRKVTVTVTAAPAQAPAQKGAKAPSIDPITYDRCSAVNYPQRQRALGQVRAALKQSPQAKVVITGFADDSRHKQTNQDVSENRARFLAAYFTSQGIPKDRIESRGLGNSRPVKGQPNRRAEIEIRE